MYYTYVLQSLKNSSLYIGYSADLKKRFESHNKGLNKATKPFIPYKLIHYEAFLNRVDAKRREVYLKSGWGLKSIHKLLEKYLKTCSGRVLLNKRLIRLTSRKIGFSDIIGYG